MPSSRSVVASVLLLVLGAFVACGDDTGGGRPTCDAIGELCHDSETDLGQDCHVFGEADDSTEEQCQEREDECRAECG
jgi:hypothetical protein